jgi:TPR repeat protein/tRNA A-37 threonylcarbamoyl transferase component Bud32
VPYVDVLAPGAVFAGDYTIERPLAEGGMGSVYIVRQTSTGARRALKLMHRELVRDARLRQRFEQEARVGALIESDHVVQVLGAGVDEATGMPWLVMELLVGEDLSKLLEARGALPSVEARDVFAQFTHAVAAAHRVGIVHRDLKPENVFVAVAQREGMERLVKVLDFGIAKVVAEARATTTQALGTPSWMAPEQTEPHSPITPAADVWAIGLIAFRMLVGKHFWVSANSETSTATMVLREAVIDPIPPASVRAAQYGRAELLPPGFDAWFSRCVARDVRARFQDAGTARDAFASLHGGTPSAILSAFVTNPTAPGLPVMNPAPAYVVAPSYNVTPLVGGTPPVAPYVVPAPVPRPPPASKGTPALLLFAVPLGLVVLVGAALGVRAFARARKVAACEAGHGEGLVEACRVACDVEPARYCVNYGDQLAAHLKASSRDEAMASYKKACDADGSAGCGKLGALQELVNDAPSAVASYTKACENKHPRGCARLGHMLERGRGVARDLSRARTLLDAACAEDPSSCALLASNMQGRPLPRPDAGTIADLYKKAAPHLDKHCRAGGVYACLELASMRQRGEGVSQDLAGALALFKKACDAGAAEGCTAAAVLALAGHDPAQGPAHALSAMRGLCSAGSLAACNDVAVASLDVSFTMREDQGDSVLRLACGDAVPWGCTENGAAMRAPGVPKDVAGAASLLTSACTGGLATACVNLGALQESGYGAPRDRSQAKLSYDKACAAGAPDGSCPGTSRSPFVAGESWRGQYTCAQGQTDLALRIVDAGGDDRVTALFDFDFGHGKTTGRFFVSGTYDAARGSIAFTPGAWIDQPPGYVTVGFSGQVSLQKTILAGRVDNASCGAVRVVRVVSDMVPSTCASSAHFVEGHGCLPIPRTENQSVLGSWSGRGTETGGSSWTMTVSIGSLEAGRCGRVSYPSLGCTADWYCTGSSDGEKIHAREIVTSGGGKCDGTGAVDMTVSGDGRTASYRWSSPKRTGTANGQLTRAPR